MKPLFCGNLDSDTCESDLEKLFSRYGKVVKVKLKSGFAFIFMDDERDAEDAIHRLDGSEFGRRGRQLHVEWSKQDHSSRSVNTKPTNTLFIVNFDPVNTKKRDLERHFGPYGKIIDIRMRSDFAFIEFASKEDARDALEATHMSKLMDCVLTVEYSSCGDQGRRNGYSPARRSRERSPQRSYSAGRSQPTLRRHPSSNMRPTKTLFVANIDPVITRMRDLELHFEPYGKIMDVRIRKNFGFVQFASQEDATKALKATDMSKLKDRVISVEYVVSNDDDRRNGYSPDRRTPDRTFDRSRDCGRSASSSRSSANLRPTKTLFVVNFDTVNTTKMDLERHFEPYGNILDVRIRKNFAFIQYEAQEDATNALEATNRSLLKDDVISVEYAACGDERRNGHSPDRRGRNRSRDSRSHDSRLSTSPLGRGIKRGSPDYSRGPSPYRKLERRGSHSSGKDESPLD